MRDVRKDTNKFLELIDQGVLEPKKLAQDLLGWLSESDVHEFALANDYLCVTGEDEESTVDESEDEDEEEYTVGGGMSKIVVLDNVEVDCFLNGVFQHKKTFQKDSVLDLYLSEIRGCDYAKFRDDDGIEFKLNYLDYDFKVMV